MAAKLHEVLAVERSRTNAASKLIADTLNKFKKEQFFSGHIKTLHMLQDSPENAAIESAAKEVKSLTTTVPETLEYMLDIWAMAEDVIYTKNKTNQVAAADLMFRGVCLASNVPVDQLLGLENRLEQLRKVFDVIPTLDASREWEPVASGRLGEFKTANSEVTSKTERITTPVVLYEATEHHPAQVDRVNTDKTVGTFTRLMFSGAATSKQKADLMMLIDDLLAEVKQARMRANSIEIVDSKIGDKLAELFMSVFK